MRTYLGLLIASGAAASSSGADTNAMMKAFLFGSSCGSDICPGHPDHPDTPKPVVDDVVVADEGAETAVVSPLSPLAGLFGLDHPEGPDAGALSARPSLSRSSNTGGLSFIELIRARLQRRGAAPSYGYKKQSCGYGKCGYRYPTRHFRRTYGGYVTKGQPQTLGYS